MGRPIGLLREGYPYLKTLGMRRITGFPIDVAFGSNDVIYILTRNVGSAFIRVWTFDDAEQLTDDLVQIGSYGKGEGQFEWPVQIITDCKGNLYVSDEANHNISTFSSDGEFITRWGNLGSKEGEFNAPTGIGFDTQGNMIVADSLNHRIQKYTSSGEFLSQFGSHGSEDGKFDTPWGVHVDELGNIYVADWGNNRIQVFTDEADHIMSITGNPVTGLTMQGPSSVTVDLHGDIYVTDWANNRVLMFDSKGRYIWKFLGDASLSRCARNYMLTNAYPNRLREMANLEEEKYLRKPTSVRVDGKLRLCIADHHSYRVQVYQKEATELDEHTISEPLRNPTLATV